ncbi:family 1 glycosylhydrolase [Enterovirga rhinocerotis]|uniref:dTDP-4-dehydrorhamnose reductase n=1 Tax=Enterovirga rhinocerotis TaxID=1339210 RepID=A0A4R7BIZ2_9HYPH|nr:family 1 glycosylhydrolase [Enterovirga rhinocerotis]TDR85310.1 dTDP-4-dehydrorhamnose reductase [Enterovirga rhinocerotis]
MSGVQLWGGLECTITRIGDDYRDQFAETGHHGRIGDLDLVAGLGIKTLRYPVLWEATSPDIAAGRDWAWHDDRLARLRELGIDPIVGLLHHGSGLRDTDLLDPRFPKRFAEHARKVARRYPWVNRFTPVNEPLTTARFSALYGHWYPHRRSYPDFLRALVNQCSATVLAMKAIRQTNPRAELIQTEDIGRVFSTGELAYQASHENERRWLSLDLLCGRVDPVHPFWPILRDHGISEDELRTFLTVRSPDMIGINHYLTSERYLDGDVGRYPPAFHGGNGRELYADVEAVRIGHLDSEVGPLARIREVAARYGGPLALTEVHHGCSRDEQLRWLHMAWSAGLAAREEGFDFRAVTLWSMFGAYDWNSLLTRKEHLYEAGAFDVRGKKPRPTALAHAARFLAETGRFDHPVLATPGWWRRDGRFYEPEASAPEITRGSEATILLVGSDDRFAAECLRIARHRGLEIQRVPGRHDGAIVRFAEHAPWAVLDASDFACPGPTVSEDLTSWPAFAARNGLPFCLLSRSDVFDARPGRAASEDGLPSPGSVWGHRQAAREEAVTAQHAGALVVRAGMLFGPGSDYPMRGNIVEPASRPIESQSIDGRFSYVPDLIHVVFDLLLDEERGVWHLVNGDPHGTGNPSRATPFLAANRGVIMPSLESALAREAGRLEAARSVALEAAE